MISYRKRIPADPLLVLATWPVACKRQDLTPAELLTLIQTHVIQQQTNTFPSIGDIASRMVIGEAQVRITMGVCSKLGYVEKIAGSYNVTSKGEYTLRGLQTIISRMINTSKLTRWKKPESNQFLR